MIKLAYVVLIGAFITVLCYPIYGILLDMGFHIYGLDILQYPPSITVPIVFIYDTIYPIIPTICIGSLVLFSISYGLYKRYY